MAFDGSVIRPLLLPVMTRNDRRQRNDRMAGEPSRNDRHLIGIGNVRLLLVDLSVLDGLAPIPGNPIGVAYIYAATARESARFPVRKCGAVHLGGALLHRPESMQRLLISLGLLIAAIGLLWPWLSKLPIGRFPGDILIDRPGFKLFAPFTNMIVLIPLARRMRARRRLLCR